MPTGGLYFLRGEYFRHNEIFGNTPVFGANHKTNQRKRRKLERQTGRKRRK